uniref:Uncharacterized protein n=1 Tax=uncultured bacterium A1Q1_fos_1093 TaxID=1256542 RepID=L7VXZ2_9BACT|nr:hypothetical protein [uncultured bacterium A1Q1_fos_1093]
MVYFQSSNPKKEEAGFWGLLITNVLMNPFKILLFYNSYPLKLFFCIIRISYHSEWLV